MNYVPHFNFYGVEAKQIPSITGEGAPTTATEGAVGCLYMNTLTGDIYKCTAVENGVYTWELLNDSDINTEHTTPFVVRNNAKAVKLVANGAGQHSYSVLSETIRSYKDVEISTSNYTEQPYLYGKSYVKNEGAPSAWSVNYIQLVFDNLCGGMEYTFCIDSRKAGAIFNNLFVALYDAQYNNLGNSDSTAYYYRFNQDKGYSFNFIMPEGNTKLIVRLYCREAENAVITFDNLYINRANSDGKYHTERVEEYGTFEGEHTIEAPINGTEISVSPESTVEIVGAVVQSVNECVPDEYGNILLPKSRFHGKKMVCFGDSITGNYAAPTDYPSVIAEMTGMTVYNCGFGGCRMANHPTPCFDAFSMYALADAITSGDFSRQDNALADSTLAANANLAIFQERTNTLKSVDWSSVDYISIAYGTNDIQGGIGIDNIDNALDTSKYIGAFRYTIEKIMSAYPHIKLLILTPIYRYYNDTNEDSDNRSYGGKHFVEWIDALMVAAKEAKVPCIDMYRTLGINKYNRRLYFPYNDGTHPNSLGRRLIGEKVAARMSAEF